MANKKINCTDIARILADKVAPNSNFEERLWFIARADPQGALEYLCLLLRTQFEVQLRQDGLLNNCIIEYYTTTHIPSSMSRVRASKLPSLINGTETHTSVDSHTRRR